MIVNSSHQTILFENFMDIQHLRLGILGGGQLGKMLALAAHKWDITTTILDPDKQCPASNVCTNFVHGDFTDYDTVYKFGKTTDILTIEIEKVNVEALLKLEEEGLVVHPSPHAIKIIGDKGDQRVFLDEAGIPGPEYQIADSKEHILELVQKNKIKIPFVQKLRTGGYDGRGVFIVRSEDDLDELLEGPSLIEELVDIEKELAVVAARGDNDEIKCFAPVEMVFKREANLLDYLMSPASLTQGQEIRATQIAIETIKKFKMQGLLAVELFLTRNNKILVNEVAPRPHNSGHHTIEANATSQYEQLLRSILGIPLGNTEQDGIGLMANLLGEPQANGKPNYQGLQQCLSQQGINIHIYGKRKVTPYRKMGHVTITAPALSEAKEKLKYVRENLRIVSYDE